MELFKNHRLLKIISGHFFVRFILTWTHPLTDVQKAAKWLLPLCYSFRDTDFNTLGFGGLDKISAYFIHCLLETISVNITKESKTIETTQNLFDLRHTSALSSEPSSQSGSPSQCHLLGRHWPLWQIKSWAAQVFLTATETGQKLKKRLKGFTFQSV